MKARNLKKRMEKLNEVVSGLKEGKQEMSKHMQELDASIDRHIVKLKVCGKQSVVTFLHTAGFLWGS